MTESDNYSAEFCYNCMEPLAEGQTVCPHCGHDHTIRQNPEDVLTEGSLLNGKYIVGKMLGRGGFGVTYIGYDLTLKIKVAIKEFFPAGVGTRNTHTKTVTAITAEGQAGFESGRQAFQDEAQVLARFNSPNIVHVREYFRENGTAYIVMDLVEGSGLSGEVQKCGGTMPWQRVLDLFKPLIVELGRLHEENLIHRDIKPDNIKVVQNKKRGEEYLVLLDFGAARRFVSENVTGTYTAMVTPGYAPIEQYNQQSRQGPYTDVYGVCATMYAALTGRRPLASTERVAEDAELPPIRNFAQDMPADTEKAIMHGLEVKGKDRTQSMQELYDELYGESKSEAADKSTGKTAEVKTSSAPAAPVTETGKAEGRKEKKKKPLWIIPLLLAAAAGVYLFAVQPLGEKGSGTIPAVTQEAAESYLQAATGTPDGRFHASQTSAVEVSSTSIALQAQLESTRAAVGTADAEATRAAVRNESEEITATSAAVQTLSAQVTATRGAVLATRAAVRTESAEITATSAAVQTLSAQVTATRGAVLATRAAVRTESVKATATSAAVQTLSAQVTATRGAVLATRAAVRTESAEITATSAAVQTLSAQVTATRAAVHATRAAVRTESAEITATAAAVRTAAAEQTPEPQVTPTVSGQGSTQGAPDYEELAALGDEAYWNGDYEKALEYLVPAADAGDSSAQTLLGMMYFAGDGVPQSYSSAIKYYKKAADQGNPVAQTDLGVMYEYGYGVFQSNRTAVEYYSKAADQDYHEGLVHLGQMYENGKGVPRSYSTALSYYKKAADQGNAAALTNIGNMYENGFGVYQSNKTAFEYYRQAADLGDAEGQARLGYMYENGLGTIQSVPKALEYYKLAADQNNTMALNRIGSMYENGIGLTKSNRAAMDYYRLSANLGDPMGQCLLGKMYENGKGTAKSYTSAVKYYTMAAEQGDMLGQYYLGCMYENGLGVEQSTEKALEYYKLSAAQGYQEAADRIEALK